MSSNEVTVIVPPPTVVNVIAEPAAVIEVAIAGTEGPIGPQGPTGPQGPQGEAGVGVPIGGTSGQVLAKASETDYDTSWVDQTGGGGSFPSPTIPAFTDVTNASLETLIESNAVVVAGDADTIWPAVVRGDGSPEIQVNSGSWSQSGIFRVGDSLKLRLTSSASGEVSSLARLYAQGVSSPWIVTTAAGSPFDTLLATLLVDAAQVIVHPLLDGYMFQDRAGTIPVTADGQLIGHVLDAGGGGYHATAISEAARMVFRDVGGIRWVEYNGINGAYSTPVLAAPGVDKAQLFAGVRKLSDAAAGIVAELSVSVGSNAGSFYLAAPESPTIRYSSLGRGNVGITTAIVAAITATGAAPDTAVITATHDIAGDLSRIARNGVYGNDATGDKGSGDFNFAGTYPIYYGARAGTSLFFGGRSYATLGPITRFSAANATAEQIEAAEAYYTARVI